MPVKVFYIPVSVKSHPYDPEVQRRTIRKATAEREQAEVLLNQYLIRGWRVLHAGMLDDANGTWFALLLFTELFEDHSPGGDDTEPLHAEWSS